MQTRLLGRTGVRVSALTFGGMSFGGDADEATSAAMFARCRDVGINMFDTADVYQKGRAEEIMGRVIRGCRDEIVLATKAYFPLGKGPNAGGSSRYHLLSAVEASLRRLRTDRIDVFYLHRHDDSTPVEETLRALDDLVCSGKILYPAASNFAAWQVVRALGIAERQRLAPLCCIQPMYSLTKRQAEVELLPMALAEGLGVFTYGPLGGGLLGGRYGVTDRPSVGRLVDLKSYRVRYSDPLHYEVAERFRALAAQRGVQPAALAIAWVASHPAVTAPILGARSVEQLDVLLGALDVEMTPELRSAISALAPAPPPATDRNEEVELSSPFA